MAKRSIQIHQECLREFGYALKAEIRDNLKFWKSQNPDEARARAAAYSLVLCNLKDAAEKTGVPLQDIGIEDYTIPSVD